MVDGGLRKEVIVTMDNKRGEYKIKKKHIIKLNKLYDEVKKEEKEVTLPTLVKSDKKESK